MKFLAILHAPYEGPGLIEEWITVQGHSLEQIFAWDIPSVDYAEQFDALIVMGGYMGVGDEAAFPWLAGEKAFLRHTIQTGKKMLGICLGAQLLAACMGAGVYKNPEPEIGWFPIRKKFFMHSWFPIFDESEKVHVFHWHGDTFDIPAGCVPLFESEACKNQAFAYEDQVLGLQFHAEMTEDLIRGFIEHMQNDLKAARFIQPEAKMYGNYRLYAETSKTLLFDLLDDFFNF